MTVSPSVLLLSIAIGGPVLLLALAVLYHGALVSRQQAGLESALAEAGLSPAMLAQLADAPAAEAAREAAAREAEAARDLLSEHVSALVVRSADALADRLEQAMAQMRGQLAQQRSSLETLLSEPPRMPAMPAMPGVPLGRAAGEHVRAGPAPSMPVRIARLIEEGLSDRVIARELRIGLEEVRIARSRGGRA